MEIKASLEKPYTEQQRVEFVIEQNHRKGYKIKETELALEAWGYTEEEIVANKEAQFEKDFFNTSLGYVRRQVTMANGFKKDFLSDLLPTISIATQAQTSVNILVYDKPDFSQPDIDWEQYQRKEQVTPQFVQECFVQLQNDFLPDFKNIEG